MTTPATHSEQPQIIMNPNTLAHVDAQVEALRKEMDREILLLREAFATKVAEQQRAVDVAIANVQTATELKFTADREAVRLALVSVKEMAVLHGHSHDKEHESYREAIEKAEASINVRLELTNNWRADFERQADTFSRQQWVSAEISRVEAIVNRFMVEVSDRRQMFDDRIGRLEQFVVAYQASQGEHIGSMKRLEGLVERNAMSIAEFRQTMGTDLMEYRNRVGERIGKVENFIVSFQAQQATIRAAIVIIPIILAIASFILLRFGL